MSCVSRNLGDLPGKGRTFGGAEKYDRDGVKMATNEWISKAEDVADKVTAESGDCNCNLQSFSALVSRGGSLAIAPGVQRIPNIQNMFCNR